MKNNKFSTRIRLFAIFLISLLFAFFCASCVPSNQGMSEESGGTVWRTGLFTTLSLSLESSNGNVTATVRNDLTLGLATVETYVYLYSCDVYVEDITQMTQEQANYTRDLNIFCEINASAPTNGESKYWCARVRYKSNDDAWVEARTVPVLFDGRI